MAVTIPRLLLINAREAAERVDIPLMKIHIGHAMRGRDGDEPTMLLLGAVWEEAEKARQAPDRNSAQSQLWECVDKISAGCRDSALNHENRANETKTAACPPPDPTGLMKPTSKHLRPVESDK